MKHNFNLLLLVVGVLFIFTSKGDQLTITFTNPVPDSPVNCSDIWSEQGIDMELTYWSGSCGGSGPYSYGNGNLTLRHSKLRLDLSTFGNINNISISMLTGCHDEIELISGDSVIVSETILGEDQTFYLYEFNNVNSETLTFLEVSNVECDSAVLFDITIDYTPICESEPISNVRNGDVYLNDACYGVIMTSPSGNCFRAKVADNGLLFTEPVDCP